MSPTGQPSPSRFGSDLPKASESDFSVSDLPVADDAELLRYQTLQSHRTVGVKASGAYSDLDTQAELFSVGEAGGGIHEDYGRVDPVQELLSLGQVLGDDCLGVRRTVLLVVGDSLVQTGNHPYCQNEVQELLVIVAFAGRCGVGKDFLGPAVAPQLHASPIHALGKGGKEARCHCLVNEEIFHGVADGGPEDFGVLCDGEGLVQIGLPAHINVADSLVVLDHWHAALFDNESDQPFSAPGDNEIDELLLLDQNGNGLPVGGVHQLASIRKSRRGQGPGNQGNERPVRMDDL